MGCTAEANTLPEDTLNGATPVDVAKALIVWRLFENTRRETDHPEPCHDATSAPWLLRSIESSCCCKKFRQREPDSDGFRLNGHGGFVSVMGIADCAGSWDRERAGWDAMSSYVVCDRLRAASSSKRTVWETLRRSPFGERDQAAEIRF
jgi:hypothetical protein